MAKRKKSRSRKKKGRFVSKRTAMTKGGKRLRKGCRRKSGKFYCSARALANRRAGKKGKRKRRR